MIKTILYVIICLTTSITYADDDDVPSHYEAECVACHEQMVSGNAKVLYTRKDRLAKDYAELKSRVSYCIAQLELNWSEEQTRSVIDYLAKRYYKYPSP